MKLKEVMTAQESLISYIEDGMQPMTSQQAYEACKEIERLRSKAESEVVWTALHCLECTLYSVYLDRKPEP